jgi:hypothetical protein
MEENNMENISLIDLGVGLLGLIGVGFFVLKFAYWFVGYGLGGNDYKKKNLCLGNDHNPNPCKIVKDGGICVECGGFIPNWLD